MTKRQPSLQRPLIVQPLILQFFILVASFTLLLALLIRMDSGGRYTDQTVAKIAAAAVVRDGDVLKVRMTPELAELRRENAQTWFMAMDAQGRRVSFGPVPPELLPLGGVLREVAFGDVRGRHARHRFSLVVRQQSSPAGPLSVIAHGKLTDVSFVVALAANAAVIPIFLLLAILTSLLTPWIVRRSLAGVARIAAEAGQIDVGRRGLRLTEAEVPREIGPLVRAVNDALSRLDDGYERQRRFIASAAHELRTPIAILQMKIEGAADPATRRLHGDVARLSTLAEQLLDLHRLDDAPPAAPIDLAALVRRVAADLAPLLIASGKSIGVAVEQPMQVLGDEGAIERVLTNLVQNAIEHGGDRVIVRVGDRGFEVEDNGPGIPPAERERVFEPFYRMRPRSTGSGLGLNLVQQVMERHRGRISILDAPHGGTIIRVAFPAT